VVEPDELEEGASHAAEGAELVQLGNPEFAMGGGAAHQGASIGRSRAADGAETCHEEPPLSRGGGRQLGCEESVQPPREDLGDRGLQRGEEGEQVGESHAQLTDTSQTYL
jgi:hypothetical protein